MKDITIELPKGLDETIYHPKKKICDYTKPELEHIRNLANFTEDELQVFNMRSKDKSNVAIAMSMNISEAKLYDIIRKVKDKIKRIS